MTSLIVYAIVAVLILVVAGVLLRSNFGRDSTLGEFDGEYSQGLWERTGLTVAEKVFDRTDYLWLRDKVGFPLLAQSLSRSRQQMAIKWLRAVRRSFNDVVLTQAPVPDPIAPPRGPGSWELLWMTLRFHLLLTYAALVVRVFGPYHRLVPPLGSVGAPSKTSLHRQGYRAAHLRNFR